MIVAGYFVAIAMYDEANRWLVVGLWFSIGIPLVVIGMLGKPIAGIFNKKEAILKATEQQVEIMSERLKMIESITEVRAFQAEIEVVMDSIEKIRETSSQSNRRK